jgi:hypothetical protein
MLISGYVDHNSVELWTELHVFLNFSKNAKKALYLLEMWLNVKYN